MSHLEILLLLLILQVKHYLADYTFQYPYMYMNKGNEVGWFSALRDHALVHALFTFIVFVGFVGIYINVFSLIALVLFDYVTHMVIDRWKAIKKHTPQDKEFWLALGKDQMMHHIVGILMLYYVMTVPM